MRQRKRRWGFEQLENRRLLAVTSVSLTTGGDLLIAGDATADNVTITENAAGTQWEIIGGAGTTVTPIGVVDVDVIRVGLQIAKPTVQDVHILLAGGADTLTIRGVNQGTQTFVGSTTIDTDSESDTVNLGNFTAPGAADFNFIPAVVGPPAVPAGGSNGNDFIGAVSIDVGGGVSATVATDATNSVTVLNTDFGRASGTPVSGHLVVHGSAGVDTIDIRGSVNNGGSIDISTLGGADDVTIGENTAAAFALDAVTLGGNLNVNTGDDGDTVTLESALALGSISVHGGAGDDTIRVGSTIATPAADRVGSSAQGDITVNGAGGDDTVTVNQATTAGALHIALGGGAAAGNTVTVQNSSFSAATSVSGGEQEDNVNLVAVNSPLALHIQTAGGDDTVSILGTLVELGVASILTGTGGDTVNIGGGSRIDTLIVVTGDGNDSVAFGDSATVEGNASVDEFFVDLGAGDDNVDSSDSSFGSAFVQGGSGGNTSSGQTFGTDVDGDDFFFEGF